MASKPVQLPGMHSPGAGFEQPFAMLDACHDRVRRSLDLLARLQTYVQTEGADDNARQAARDVLRYFDIAAPLHHQDEELHVFPLLLARSTDAALHALVRQLQQDHVTMAQHWSAARQVLQVLAEGGLSTLTPEQQAVLVLFSNGYEAHLQHEDVQIYPAAQALLGDASEQAMGQEMAQRRRV